MNSTPTSGLSPEAKEFVPLVQNPTPSIPLYVDENTVASIYPSDQQPLMVQSIYPMILTNSKLNDNPQFPEIEFHIQPSQQQQFHIDSCTNIQQQSTATNGNISTTNASQIVLLPITSPTNPVTLTSYYPESQIIYSNEQVCPYYPIDYCEQPLINFSLQQPTSITKSNRLSSQTQRSTFRQYYGINYSTHRPTSSRGGNRGGGHTNTNTRNSYYDYSNRRNGSSYIQNSGRGNSTNSKRISSSYHQNDYNHYYHGSRSRGYAARSSQQHDENRKENYHDYYNHDNDTQQSSHINDDGVPFEFRPEDFPSLPINNTQPDKSSSPVNTLSTNTKATSSWNVIVSTSRRRSTSPQAVPQSQDQRSDRSRSYNNKSSSNNERKSSTKKPINQPTKSITSSASKLNSQDDQQHSQTINISNSSTIEKYNDQDDGFIQTKQQYRRLKRKNRNREESTPIIDLSSISHVFDDENSTNEKFEYDSNLEHKDKSNPICLTDMFNNLTTSTEVKQENSHHKTTTNNNSMNLFNSKSTKDHKSRKSIKLKLSINKETDDHKNQRQSSLSKLLNDEQSNEKSIENKTDTTMNEVDHQNSKSLYSSSNNSSDTSDYDDAVDNFDDE